MNGLAQRYGVSGLVGVRVMQVEDGRYVSPVQTDFVWQPGLLMAECPLHCSRTPGDHPGMVRFSCGLYAFLDMRLALRFAGERRKLSDLVMLVECCGRVVVHEHGLRAELARVAAVLDWAPLLWPSDLARSSPEAGTAADYFEVPLVDAGLAQQLIETQRAAWHCDRLAA
jgi:hypothetical protein